MKVISGSKFQVEQYDYYGLPSPQLETKLHTAHASARQYTKSRPGPTSTIKTSQTSNLILITHIARK